MSRFIRCDLIRISREHNSQADALAKLASTSDMKLPRTITVFRLPSSNLSEDHQIGVLIPDPVGFPWFFRESRSTSDFTLIVSFSNSQNFPQRIQLYFSLSTLLLPPPPPPPPLLDVLQLLLRRPTPTQFPSLISLWIGLGTAAKLSELPGKSLSDSLNSDLCVMMITINIACSYDSVAGVTQHASSNQGNVGNAPGMNRQPTVEGDVRAKKKTQFHARGKGVGGVPKGRAVEVLLHQVGQVPGLMWMVKLRNIVSDSLSSVEVMVQVDYCFVYILSSVLIPFTS
ncbi:hypothetical protein LWI29_023957 [Acer saccharum]|uniref:Uncharacterized protein n=1 Tax=Acer saccharum TaxID=4024 RepID=A0AA39SKR4_ACESA|nr:hypothetical protein LWI29_023957 [Acer saccharum]